MSRADSYESKNKIHRIAHSLARGARQGVRRIGCGAKRYFFSSSSKRNAFGNVALEMEMLSIFSIRCAREIRKMPFV